MRQLIWHFYYVDTELEGSEIDCYNTEDNRISVEFELQTEKGIENLTIHSISREDFHLHKIASKWVPHALTEVEKWTR
jgi:hypothetical protein